jgi:hypothetical protein
MKKQNISEMWGGWFIGNFDPSVLKTKDFEVGVLTRTKALNETPHYHAIGTEYNVLLSGSMSLNDEIINIGDIFIIEPNQIARPVFHEDCQILCVKTPSVPGDKYSV